MNINRLNDQLDGFLAAIGDRTPARDEWERFISLIRSEAVPETVYRKETQDRSLATYEKG